MTKKEIKASTNTELVTTLIYYGRADKLCKYMQSDIKNICKELAERGFDVEENGIMKMIMM